MARRIFRSRGKGAARTGRRIQDQESGKRQIVLDENVDENVYFSLPKQKKRITGMVWYNFISAIKYQ